jgi:hypothetical protein
MFLMWPVVLSFVLNPELFRNWPAMLTFFAIVVICSGLNSVVALFCSTLFTKTSVSMMMSYVGLISLYLVPVAVFFLLTSITFSDTPELAESWRWLGVTSPFLTLASIPMTEVLSGSNMSEANNGSWVLVASYFATTAMLIVLLSGSVILLFRDRWRITGVR